MREMEESFYEAALKFVMAEIERDISTYGKPKQDYAYVKAEYLAEEIGNSFIEEFCMRLVEDINIKLKELGLPNFYADYDGDYVMVEEKTK